MAGNLEPTAWRSAREPDIPGFPMDPCGSHVYMKAEVSRTVDSVSQRIVELLREGREREKRQSSFYRRLAAAAEDEGRPDDVERLNELLADEQHHLSRLTARLLELGDQPPDLPPGEGTANLEGWEAEARAREAGEVAFYKSALTRSLDDRTRDILQEILHSECHHREQLRGKWMSA
ncbi:MAG: ferritin-like domain-containing protein [Gemmatimonadales bacterium]|nr:MAG: ferritin-like domain-containing protein [Gemmatimonadales bacterium]